MKKLYFLLVAMVVSMAANAYDYYLNGEFANWKAWTTTALADYKFTATSATTFELDLSKTSTPDLSGKFVIAAFNGTNVDWSAKIGTKTGKPKEGVPYTYAVGGGDISIDGTIKKAKLTIDTAAKTLLITGNAEANSFDVVYMIGDFGDGWDTTTTAYPLLPKAGADDTYEGTHTITGTAAMSDYFYTVPKCGTQILAPSGSDIQPTSGMPYNLTPGNDKSFELKPGTYYFQVIAKQEANSCMIIIRPTEGPAPEITFYWDNTDAKWSSITAYFTDGTNSDDYEMEETSVDNIFSASCSGDYTSVYFSNGTTKSPTYTLKGNYIYSMTNSGSEYTEPVDYSGWYVNVLGEYNGWAENGQNPNADGISIHKNLAIGDSTFKIKVWNGQDQWHSNGDVIALDTWTAIPGDNNSSMSVAGAKAGEMYDVKFNCATNEVYVSKSTEVIDYTQWYVNVVGEFNNWEYNGQRPDREGVVILPAENVNTAFKIKTYDGTADSFYAVDGTLPLDTWTSILGNQENMVLPAEAQSGAVTMTFNCVTKELKVVLGDAGVEGIIVDENAAPVYYNLQGVRVAEPTQGLYIVRRGNTVAKEIVK